VEIGEKGGNEYFVTKKEGVENAPSPVENLGLRSAPYKWNGGCPGPAARPDNTSSSALGTLSTSTYLRIGTNMMMCEHHGDE